MANEVKQPATIILDNGIHIHRIVRPSSVINYFAPTLSLMVVLRGRLDLRTIKILL